MRAILLVFTLFNLLYARKPPKIIPLTNTQTLEEGFRFKSFCGLIQGSEPLQFEWFKDRNAILFETGKVNIETTLQQSIITVEKVTSKDTGNYTCVVTNDVGKDSFTLSLIVKVPLKWKYEPRSITAVLGTDIVLECDAIGYPQPNIKWFRNEPFEQLITDQGVLKIEKIALSNNTTYECVAENGVDNS
ncbi:Down syndrome cell adhesion molecule-like protein Dscam2, partial [Leptotrombidium deliense]